MAKKTAEKTYTEPTCVKCGCTEYNACIGVLGEGCAWRKLNKKTNAGLCTSCAPRK